jgi:hypothetical protein
VRLAIVGIALSFGLTPSQPGGDGTARPSMVARPATLESAGVCSSSPGMSETLKAHAAAERRAMVTCDVADFVELAGEFIAANIEHHGIVLAPSTFGTDDFSGIADGVERLDRDYSGGLAGAVVYLRRSAR